MCLSKYLAIEDWFKISALDKRFYTKWISSDCVDAIHMRDLVYKRFKWKYQKANPFHWVRKHTNNQVYTDNFKCVGGCGKQRSKYHMISPQFARPMTCHICFNSKWDPQNLYVPYKYTPVNYYIILSHMLGRDRNNIVWKFLTNFTVDNVRLYDFEQIRLRQNVMQNSQISIFKHATTYTHIARTAIVEFAKAEIIQYGLEEKLTQFIAEQGQGRIKRQRI